MPHVDSWSERVTLSSQNESYKNKGESPLWVMWCHDVSCDITPHLMSFLSSEGPDIHRTGGVGDAGVIVWDLADPSVPTVFVRVTAVHFNMPGAIAEDTLGKLGALFCWMPHMRTPPTDGILVVWTIFPPIGEVVDACIKHGAGDIGGERGIVKD